MSEIITADWILPVTGAPVKNGAVVLDRMAGAIVDVGEKDRIQAKYGGEIRDLPGHVVMPGLVNPHVHLDFSALRGKIEPDLGFGNWVVRAIGMRKALSDGEIAEGIRTGIGEIVRTGTVAIGDITKSELPYEALKSSPLTAVMFIEETGFPTVLADEVFEKMRALQAKLEGGQDLRISLAPHATYSVSPGLIQKIGAHNRAARTPTTIHLAESREEVEFVREGTGFFREMLEGLDRWDPGWKCPGTSPVSYLDALGFLSESVLAVHLVQADEDDIGVLAKRKVSVCTCPRSNEMIGTGVAPVEAMLKAGIRVCIGTDSLASNEDLNIFNEIRRFRGFHPGVSNLQIVEMVTLNAAAALGIEDRYGSLDPGKSDRIIAVRTATDEPFGFLDRVIEPKDIVLI